MCIHCANVNPSRPCQLQNQQGRLGRKRKNENVNEEVDREEAAASRLPWKEAIRQAALKEDFERDVMLQPKRHSWDSYVPSKSKSKTVVVSGGPEDPLLQGWPWSQAIRSLEGLKEVEEKKKVKDEQGELLKVKVDEHFDQETKGEEDKVKEGGAGYKN